MIAATFTMDLYCKYSIGGDDNESYAREMELHEFDEFPHQYVDETRQGCMRQARRHGWIFHGDGDVTCPKCRPK